MPPPRDRYNGLYITFLLAGAAFLLPYYCFTIAGDYYRKRYGDFVEVIYGLSLKYIIAAFLAVLGNNLLLTKLSLNVRIMFGYVISCMALVILALGGLIGWAGSAGYIIDSIAMAVVAVGCAVQQSSFYGYTCKLPKKYMQAVMAGESAAGILVCVHSIISKGLSSDQMANTAFIHILAIILMYCCFFLYYIVKKSEFVHYFTVGKGSNAIESTDDEATDMRTPVNGNHGPEAGEPIRNHGPEAGEPISLSFPHPLYSIPSAPTAGPSTLHRLENITHTTESEQGLWNYIKRGLQHRWELAKTLRVYMLSIALSYFVTFCFYRAVELDSTSCHPENLMPIIIMTLFHVSDLIGKIFAVVSPNLSKRSLFVISCCRAFFSPLFALSTIPVQMPFLSDAGYRIFFSVVLGLSNGLVATSAMTQAPAKVTGEQREIAGNLMTLSYSLGLTTSSLLIFLANYIFRPRRMDICSQVTPTVPTFHYEIITPYVAHTTTQSTTTTYFPDIMIQRQFYGWRHRF